MMQEKRMIVNKQNFHRRKNWRMKSYLEIYVPITFEDSWFKEMRASFDHIPVIWQKGYYHITMAFCDETPDNINIPSILDKYFRNLNAPKICFNKLDAFQATSGMYIVNLGTDDIPTSFSELVKNVRKDLTIAGCVLESDFMLHVTLGRIKDTNIQFTDIKELVSSIPQPVITLSLNDVDYREFRGRTIYKIKLQR